MKKLFMNFKKWLNSPTNNPGTDSPRRDEHLEVLKSIDRRLEVLQNCVEKGPSGWKALNVINKN